MKFRLQTKELEKQVEQDEEDFVHFNKEIKKLSDEDKRKHQQIEDLKILLSESKAMVDKVQQNAERKKEQEVEVIREEMRQMTQKFNLYREVVEEEIKVNEGIRYTHTWDNS